jgi:hypothetical protein
MLTTSMMPSVQIQQSERVDINHPGLLCEKLEPIILLSICFRRSVRPDLLSAEVRFNTSGRETLVTTS